MMSPPTQLRLVVPRSLTAPDAWIAILLAVYLQFKQYSRQKNVKGKIHAGAKSKPNRIGAWSLVHGWLLTDLYMMVSPLSNQASDLNADMVDLQSEKELNTYASKVASGKAPKKKKPKNGSGSGVNEGKAMEVRSRRIVKGELVYDFYYPVVETTINLALSVAVGLVSRWLFSLNRSLKLSSSSSMSMSPSGPGGPCCSPYRGGEDEGTRLPGSFERLLACVLIKQEGDNAGTLLFTILLSVFFVCLMRLAWSVSTSSVFRREDQSDEFEADDESEKRKKSGGDTPTHRRIHPRKVKIFIVGAGATLSSLMLFHTPALLRMLGLDGLTEAVEELSARILLFGNLLGVISLPEMVSLNEPHASLQNLMNGLLVILALAWGYIASWTMSSINETARNAAHVFSPSTSKKKRVETNPNEMLDLINVRMMLLIQAMAPVMIMCTYLFNQRFAETTKYPARSGQTKMNFSKQYLQNSGLFIRCVLSWCFIGSSFYTFRTLLQSFLDQAATVASAMATLGEDFVSAKDVNVGRGSRGKRPAASSSQTPSSKRDPFSGRYKSLVLTAGHITVFPALVLAMLAVSHLQGGDGSKHPGVGYESQPKDAPRTLLPVKGLLPPYCDQYMSWIANQRNQHGDAVPAGHALLHAAALSQSSWDPAPFRDSAHKKVVNWFGKDKFCYPPEVRSVKAVARHVNFLLEDDGGDMDEASVLTINPLTGRELLHMAPYLPLTLVDALIGRTPAEQSCKSDNSNLGEAGSNDPINSQGSEEGKVSEDSALETHYPSFSLMISFVASHKFLTPTVVFPIIDTFSFLSSLWWNYWYSVMTLIYWIRLRGVGSLRITA